MATLTPTQIAALALGAGWSPGDATTATAIALAESSGRTDAVGDEHLTDSTWGPSIGLWQVRSLRAEDGSGAARDATRLTDPQFNARAAYQISSGGGTWRPWSMYTNGGYRRHLGVARDGVANAAADPSILDDLAAIPFGLGYGAGLPGGVGDAAASAAATAASAVLSSWGLGWLTTPAGRRAAAQIVGGGLLVLVAYMLYSGGDSARMIKDLVDLDLGGTPATGAA